MKAVRAPLELAKGQLWQIGTGFILIDQIGKRLIHYKVQRQQVQRAVRTQISAIDTFAAYLKENDARLIQRP